jgi:hypothetical protein
MQCLSLRAIATALALSAAAAVHAAESDPPLGPGQGEMLLFTSADGLLADSANPDYDTGDFNVTVDVLGSLSAGSFRMLGELLLSTEEQELERFQFGWELRPDTYLWVGRFHQPASVWNTRHHHGQYLQPSITRPVIESWEDDGGVLPQHFAGALFETRLPVGSTSGLSLQGGMGAGPALVGQELVPIEIYEPEGLGGRLSWGLRASYLPSFTGDDEFGVVLSGSEVDLARADLAGPGDHVDLRVGGLFATWQRGPSRLDAVAYYVRSTIIGGGQGADDFAAGYVQYRHELGRGVNVLGRLEGSTGSAKSAYVALFPDFVKQKTVADLRWDFRPRQALTLEVAGSHARRGDFREIRLQWSAVLP